MPRPDRRGFTLIEVVVSLAIGSAVVLMVHQAFGASVDLVARLDAARQEHRHVMRAQLALIAVFGSLEIGRMDGAGFQGDSLRVQFASRVRGTIGTAQTSTVPTIVDVSGTALLLRREGTPAETLMTADDVAFDFLLAYGEDAKWLPSFHSPVGAPLAVRVRLKHGMTSDTLLYLIGPRG